MRHLALLFTLILSAQQAYSQSYGELISLANSAYDTKNYQLSGEYFDEAFNIKKDNYTDTYNAACSWSLAGNLGKSLDYLEYSLEHNPHISWGKIIVDSDFAFVRIQNGSKYKILEKKYHHHADSILHFEDVIQLIMANDEYNTTFRNKTIIVSDLDFKKSYYASVGFKDSIFRMPNQNVSFFNCKFIAHGNPYVKFFNIENWEIESLSIINSQGKQSDYWLLKINNCVFDNLFIRDIDMLVDITACNIREFNYSCDFNEMLDLRRISLKSSTLGELFISGTNLTYVNLEGNSFNFTKPNSDYNFNSEGWNAIGMSGKIHEVKIRNNSFGGLDSLHIYGYIMVKSDIFNFNENTLKYPFTFNNMVISNQLKMTNNSFDAVDFSEAVFPEFNTYIPFQQFDNSKIALFQDEIGLNTISNSLDAGFIDQEKFETLIYMYQRLYNNYRLRGEINSANLCYIAIKNLHIDRDKQIQSSNPTLKNYFKLKIGQLLGFYVEHGTNPAKALVISFYIILLFAVFYFFFPSEWDTTSKARLISNFKDFRQKNEKGYVKPFFIMLGGFTLSLINALTLSLNSFVTLGFGTIPTKGLARYVCIIQGFIGWFLLSIFTVALINQVLA